MLPANSVALKEWAAVCLALATGRTAVLLRKGGLHEPRGGFRLQAPEFWLLPTQFHQQPGELAPQTRDLLAAAEALQPPQGRLHIALYAVVEDVQEIGSIDVLDGMADLHVLSPEAARQRFTYRRPGLSCLLVRAYQRTASADITDEPRYAGCRSWVPLERPLETHGLQPVLDEPRFASVRERWRGRLAPDG